jgi:ATP-dependent helicase/nuclease subunit A
LKESYISKKFRKPAFYKTQSNALERGTAVHTFMQFVDYRRCVDSAAVEQERDRLVFQNLLSQTQAAMIDPEEIAAFFASDLGRKLQQSENVLREFKFSILVDADTYYPGVSNEQILLQGVVDCALVEGDGITVVDFKTDRVTLETVDEIAAGYRHQVVTYTRALERIYKLPVKESYLYFVRLGAFVKI